VQPENNKEMEAVAKLKNYPTSPRKMRLLADLIRGHKVEKVLAELEHNPKHPAVSSSQTCVECYQQLEAKKRGW
jgi:large subunit ribosomal protein L22